jgi:tRNA(Arg) A34 adenosine deaminase TadA
MVQASARLAAAEYTKSSNTNLARVAGKSPMQQAFAMRASAEARGDQAYGAVVVRNGEVVGFGPSRVVTDTDATAHAEMVAIRDASRHLGRADLSDCELYSTSRPCRMCETAAYWAGVRRLYVGKNVEDVGAPTYCN